MKRLFFMLAAVLISTMAMAEDGSRLWLRYDEVNHDVINVETGEIVKHIDHEAGER